MAEDQELIDKINGITWDDVRWSEPGAIIESYTFKTSRDLAIARAKRTAYHMQKISEFLYDVKLNEEVSSNQTRDIPVHHFGPDASVEDDDDEEHEEDDFDEEDFDDEDDCEERDEVMPGRRDEILEPEIRALAEKAEDIRRNLGI